MSHDLTKLEQEKQKVLYRHFKAAQAKKYSAKLTNGRLYINGKSYTYEELVSTDTRLLRSNSNKVGTEDNSNVQASTTQVSAGNLQLAKILKNISVSGNNNTDLSSQTVVKQTSKQTEKHPPTSSSSDVGARGRIGSTSKSAENTASRGTDRKK